MKTRRALGALDRPDYYSYRLDRLLAERENVVCADFKTKTYSNYRISTELLPERKTNAIM